jgi:hypothetical protein
MEDNRIIKVAAILIVASVVTPVIIAGATCIASTVNLEIKKLKFNRKMKQGIKDGSIIKIDGKFYEVEVNKEEA